jgi:hypothetical protein
VKDVSRTDCRIRGHQIRIVAVLLHGHDAYLEKFLVLLEQL